MLPLLLALMACDPAPSTTPPSAEPAADEHAAEEHAAEEHAAEHAAGALELQLDGTAKWQMDPHTRTVMGEIRETLASSAPESAADAQALQATLQGQLDSLISGCTMTGPAHDQLHAFLSAFMPAVQELGGATDAATAKARHAHLHQLVVQYDSHFE